MKLILGNLSEDQLRRVVRMTAAIDAAETLNGMGYTRAELEALYIDRWRFWGGIEQELGISAEVDYQYSLSTGAIWEKER